MADRKRLPIFRTTPFMSYITTPPSTTAEAVSFKRPLHQKPGARQFVKFCIVGLSSTVINIGASNILQYVLHYPLVPSVTVAFLLSCFNGFFWNRRWTFRHSRGHSAATQSMRFVAVNSVGLVLSNSIIVLIVALYESSRGTAAITARHLLMMFIAVFTSKHAHNQLVFNVASIIATGFVVFWNFFANRLWTFRHKNAG